MLTCKSYWFLFLLFLFQLFAENRSFTVGSSVTVEEPFEEIVIPIRIIINPDNITESLDLSPSKDDAYVQYRINWNSKNHTLNLFKSRVTPDEGFILRVIGSKSDHTVYQQESKDCHYSGHTDQLWISVNLCNGIRGIIIDGNDTFNITPFEYRKRVGFIHRFRREKKDTTFHFHDGDRRTIKIADRYFEQKQKRHRSAKRAVNEEKLVEIYIVIDNTLFGSYYIRNDTNMAVQYTERVIQYLDMLFRPVGIRTVLIGLETWNISDQIVVSRDATELLNTFLDYSETKIVPYMKPPDIVALISGTTFANMVVGMAYVGSMCGQLSGTVVQNDNQELKVAVTLAHEIGHTLGLIHDDKTCTCSATGGKCIMDHIVSLNTVQFSSCSHDNLQKYFANGGGSCLYDKPQMVYNGPKCGNGILEKGEMCDCGDSRSCAKSPCCLPGCKLKTGSECSSGGCCENCKIKRKCSLCRPSQNECDLDEYCDGINEECPENYHKRDMIPCGTNTAEGFCYQGRCRSNQAQCEYIWGKGSTPSHSACFEGNKYGTVSGNCGTKSQGVYNKCNRSDVMCGSIFCDSSNKHPVIPGQQAIRIVTNTIRITGKTITCKAAQIDLGADVPDPGLVDDGSPCLRDRKLKTEGICQNRKCVKLQNIKIKSCPLGLNGTECSGKGICNNKGECLCHHNFTGDDCSKETFPCLDIPKEENIDSTLEPWKIVVIAMSCAVLVYLVTLGIICIIMNKNNRKTAALFLDRKTEETRIKPKKKEAWGKKGQTTQTTGKIKPKSIEKVKKIDNQIDHQISVNGS